MSNSLKTKKINEQFSFSFSKLITYLLIALLSFIFIMPFYWMVTTAVKSPKFIFQNPPQWFPNPINIKNFATIFERMPFWTYIGNTLLFCVLLVVGNIFSAPMIAYSITKVPWKGSKIIFPLILATMMIPWQVTQIPMFSTWSKLKLVDTLAPLALPAFFGAPYYIYLMRQFIKSLPDSVFEAGRIDGASEVRILYTLVYPMCKPVILTIAVLSFIAGWNDLNGPLLYLQSSDNYTLSIGLQMFLTSTRQEWDLLMAASTLFTIPLVVIFFIAQNQLITGISTTSGLK